MHLLIINAVFIFSKAIFSLSTFSTDLNPKLSLILSVLFILPSKLPHLLLLHFNLETGSYFSFFPQHPQVSPNCWVFQNISVYLHRNYTANSQVLKCNSYISKYSFLISTFLYLNNKCWIQVVLGVKAWQNLLALGVKSSHSSSQSWTMTLPQQGSCPHMVPMTAPRCFLYFSLFRNENKLSNSTTWDSFPALLNLDSK